MEIHTCRKVRLGPPDGWDWRQRNISVPYWRIYWNDSPGSFVEDSSGEVELGPDRLVAIPPRTVYSTRAETPVTHFYIHFTVEEPYASIAPGVMVFESRDLVSLGFELALELKDGPLPAKCLLKVRALICELLLSIPDSQVPPERSLDSRISSAMETLDADPELSNEELARASGMGRSSFLELFRRETGSSPQALSRRRRLERACLLLHFGGNSIKQIATDTGFFDRYHFSKAFKKEYGSSPAKFRSQLDAIKG